MAKAKPRLNIKAAIKKPGTLRATAARHGALKNGISHSWLKQAAAGKGVSKKTAQRARFAVTLGKIRPKSKTSSKTPTTKKK